MRYVYLILAALLLLCLAPMPYGYYQLVRFISMVVFALMAYQFYNEKREGWAICFGALALLFQPFFKIALGRAMWNIVDVLVALLLIMFWYKDSKEKGN
jgi:hypothetical protein